MQRSGRLAGGKRLRINLVLERLEPARGGLEAYAAAWAEWLLVQGVAVAAFTRFAGDWPDRPAGLALATLGPAGGGLLAEATRLERAAREAGGLLHDFGAGLGGDLFHPLFGLRATAQAAERRGLGWPGLGHSLRREPRRLALRRLEARQLASRPLLVACSQRVARDFQRRYGLAAQDVAVLPNAVPSAHYRPADAARRAAARAALGLPDDAPLFLQVAHNFRLKGVATAIRALAHLAGQGLAARLAIVGRGPDPAPMRALAAALGVGERVHLLGVLEDTRLAYAAADALVHPTLYDACSLVALEALAAGLPLAISVEDGASELITDGVQGWLIRRPGDHREVAFQMKRLLDPGLRGAMAAQARVLALHGEREAAFRRLLALAEARLSRPR